MIEVDHPAIVAPPVVRTRRTVGSLAVLAALGVASGALPWERWCGSGGRGFQRVCFHAGLWSGSASLFGLLAVILGVVFVVLAIARGWARSNKLPPAGAGLMAATFAALGAKIVIVLVDGQRTSNAQTPLNPVSVGTWLGLAVTLIGVSLLVLAIAGQPAIRRAISVTLTVMIAIGLLAIPYARSGLAWWGGPLVPPEYLGGGNGAGLTVAPHETGFFDSTLYIQNYDRLPATLDRLVLVNPSSPLRVVSTYVVNGCSAGSITATDFSRCTAAIPGWVMSPGPASDRPLGAALQMPTPGTYRVGWFQIDYTVGLLHFEIFRTDQLVICAPAPGHQGCPGSGIG